MEPLSNGKALLFPYLIPSKTPTGAIIICPGGGYAGLAAHEGEPVARWANSLGYAAFVLQPLPPSCTLKMHSGRYASAL